MPRLMQIAWLALAAGLFAASGLLQRPLDEKSVRYELVAPDDAAAQTHPEVRLLTMAPGGLRGMVTFALWQREEALKNAGQFHEAMHLASIICKLQPRFPGVWAFQAWNMGWNISVATHTPQERWMWVNQAIRLLRDEGIALNPKSLMLYKELGWIFFEKMGGNSDEMHMVYKRRWAAMMQRLLGAPPAGTAKDVIEAFRPIAKAPIDRTPRRQGKRPVQEDQLAIVLQDRSTAQYAAMLERYGVAVDWSLLDAYNRYSLDEAVQTTRIRPLRRASQRDKELSALINDPSHAPARNALLAFVRAQLLWNEYKMDPRWMLELMEFYDAPLDWRIVMTHGIYWVSYGVHACDSINIADVNSLNTDRVLLLSLYKLTFYGRLSYLEDPGDPDMPQIAQWTDARYIQPTEKEYDRFTDAVNAANAKLRDIPVKDPFESGHVNYTVIAIETLYSMDRLKEASDLLEYIKKRYKKSGGEWDLTVEDFVYNRFNRDGAPIRDVTISQVTSSIVSAHINAVVGKTDAWNRYMSFARFVYDKYQQQAAVRNQFEPFEFLQAQIVAELLMKPEIHGVKLDFADRAKLYRSLDNQLQLLMYDQVAMLLRQEVQAQGLDFDTAFPPPRGLAQWRVERQKMMESPPAR